MPVAIRVPPPRWVRLCLRLDMTELGGVDAPALTLAATLIDLAVLYDLAGKARRYDCPLVELLATLRVPDLSLPSALEPPRDLAAYAWSAARLVPLEGREIPPADPDRLALLEEQLPLHQMTSFLMVDKVSFGPPLGLEINLAWEDFAEDGGGWIFIDPVEQLFGAPGRIDVAPALAQARSIAQAEQKPQGLELLSRDTAGVKLAGGRLAVEARDQP